MLTLKLNLLMKDKAKNKYIKIDLLKMYSKNKLKRVITDFFFPQMLSQSNCNLYIGYHSY